MATRLLILCGLLSALLYVVMLVAVPLRWPDYHSASWTVSELSAIGAPTRSLWVSLAMIWTALYVAFGAGVWLVADGQRALRGLGSVLIAAGIFGCFWPPMHQREVLAAGGGSATDTLHIVWTAVNGLLTLTAMGLGARALGKSFRRYSIASMAVLVLAGTMTSSDAARVEANLPTPWIGVWERVNIGVWLLWVTVLALALMRRAPRGSFFSRRTAGAAKESWS
jgi:hypothetical protein